MKRIGLNGNQLKLIALITMTIDHIGLYFFPSVTVLRIIGRVSMPIYAYMIAEGCRYTRNKQKYLLLTLGVGLVCQIVYYVAMRSLYQCILITFSLSIILICLLEYGIQKRSYPAYFLFLLGLGAVGVICVILPRLLVGTDFSVCYGLFGVLLPVFIYVGKDQTQRFSLAAIGLCLLNYALGGIQWYSLLSLPLLAMYDGSRGKYKLKYLFYIYYPLHLAALYGIGLLIGQ